MEKRKEGRKKERRRNEGRKKSIHPAGPGYHSLVLISMTHLEDHIV